jgi:hypothetical protein
MTAPSFNPCNHKVKTRFPKFAFSKCNLYRRYAEAGVVFVFRHGAACLPHASLAVERGKKVVMRSDVAFR